MFLPYVYIVRNRNTKKFYIGMRSANKVVAEQDLGTYYFTSSKHVKNNFQEFDKEIVAYFKDQISAFEFENNLIKEYWEDPLLLNKHYQKSMTKFSMTGAKRTDLAEYNRKTKRKPKEDRRYQCIECSKIFTKLEFCHYPIKEKPFCSQGCAAATNGRETSLRRKGTTMPHLHGRKTWNKGLPNPTSAENGKKGAAKLSAKVKGRTRSYREDGSWTWQYPNK
jgi:hypothetical protein